MRWTSLLGLALVASTCSAQEKDAEKLFKEMETKIRAAKSLHFEFESVFDVDGRKTTSSGSFDLAEGRKKFRIKRESTTGKDSRVLLAVSDGTTTYSKEAEEVFKNPIALEFKDNHLSLIVRGGVSLLFNVCQVGPMPMIPGLANFDADIGKSLVVKNFKLADKKKLADQDVQGVEYLLVLPGEKETMKLSVWIDTKTHLPVKQALAATVTQGGKSLKSEDVTTFRAFVVDGAIDPKLFEVPK